MLLVVMRVAGGERQGRLLCSVGEMKEVRRWRIAEIQLASDNRRIPETGMSGSKIRKGQDRSPVFSVAASEKREKGLQDGGKDVSKRLEVGKERG
jgi:hypothetical protein